MKQFLLGFAEGYFIVSLIIYIATYMKFVKSILKVWPEIMVLLSSMSYIIIRLVADINKVSLPTWFDNFNIPTIALFMMVFILLYRSKEKKNG